VQQVAAPTFAHPTDVGDVVAEPGGDQDAACGESLPVGEGHLEPGAGRGIVSTVVAGGRAEVGDGAGDELASVAGDLVPALLEQVAGGSVPAEEAVHVRGRRVARLIGVDDGDPAAGAGEDQAG
jgi:hypothetical protein